VLAAMAPFEEELFKAARAEGRHERHDALAFDALVALAEAPIADSSSAGAKSPGVTGVVRIDHSALVRGWTEPGEVCEIVGHGPIPVAVASRLLDDCFLKAVVVDSTDVLAVSHLGRTIPARLRTAVEEMHRECDIEGCHVTTGLQIDHNQPVEEFGKTELCNLGRLCLHHHHHKHRHRLRLEGPPGRKWFVPSPIPVAIC
jgi:hypothetical protein